MTSPKVQKTTLDKDGDMGSADFEMSASLSPGKLDRHLEKILNEQNKIGQEQDFEDLMSNIEKES